MLVYLSETVNSGVTQYFYVLVLQIKNVPLSSKGHISSNKHTHETGISRPLLNVDGL